MYTVDQILRAFWDRTLPIDPIAIAKMLSVNIVTNDQLGYSGHFHFVQDAHGNQIPTITYNPSENPQRVRFTIAHELGHFINGDQDSRRDTSFSFSIGNRDPREVAANRFAADLLMPKGVVEYLIYEKRMTEIEELAEAFNVSVDAMYYRLVNLGLIHNAG